MEHSYRNLQSRTTWLCRLLYLAVALDAVSLISNGYQRMVLQQAVDGSYESTEALQASAEASDFWQHLISIPTLALMLLTFVLAGIWSTARRPIYAASVQAGCRQALAGQSAGISSLSPTCSSHFRR